MIETKRWVNPSQPQLLQIAVFLLYFTGAIAVLAVLSLRNGDGYVVFAFVDFFNSENAARLGFLGLAALSVIGGNGIANERKMGYYFGLAAAILPLLCRVYVAFFSDFKDLIGLFEEPISLMFDVALVALLLHPQSREYERIWFK